MALYDDRENEELLNDPKFRAMAEVQARPSGAPVYDREKLKAEQDAADKSNRTRSIIAQLGDDLSQQQGWGNYFLHTLNPTSHGSIDFADKLNEANNPTAKWEKTLSDYRAAQKSRSGDLELADEEASRDPNDAGFASLKEAVSQAYPGLKIPEGMNRAQFEKNFPILAKPMLEKMQNENWKAQKNYEFGLQKSLLNDKSNATAAKEMSGLVVPGVGYAHTEQDAKDMKSASEMKASFDAKADELIKLRAKYGTEYMNREAVARGKQLSRELLLSYKGLQKLGVLSKSDEDIVGAIIPEDPLGTGANVLGMGDATLSTLKNFKKDTGEDFNNQVKSRIRNPEQYLGSQKSETETKTVNGAVYVKVPGGWKKQ